MNQSNKALREAVKDNLLVFRGWTSDQNAKDDLEVRTDRLLALVTYHIKGELLKHQDTLYAQSLAEPVEVKAIPVLAVKSVLEEVSK